MTMRKHREKNKNGDKEQLPDTVTDLMDMEEDLPFLPDNMKRNRSSDERKSGRFEKTDEESVAGIHLFPVSDDGEKTLISPSEQEPKPDSFFCDIDLEQELDIPIDENDESEVYSERKYIVLIIYDIISNKQRVKMAKLLSGYGNRVQKSAFEARLNKKQYARLLRDIKKMLKQDDNVRIYKLYGYEEILTFGDKEYDIIEDVIVI